MFVSAYTPDLAANADVIVVGSGLAAIPIAMTLSNSNRRVLIIEGGDTNETARAAALTETYDYGVFSEGYWARHWIRALGGTSRRWSGWLAALDPRDFRQNTVGVDWPITLDTIKASYEQAAQLLGRPATIPHYREPYLDTPFVYKPFSRGAPLRVHEAFGERLATDPRIVVLTQHVVTRLAANSSRSTISGIDVTDYSSERKVVRITPNQRLVLACGGVGNAQILMQPAAGSPTAIGNESTVVGQFLMEHPHARCAEAFIAADTIPRPPVEFGQFTDAFVLGDAQYSRHGLLGCTLSVEPVSERDEQDRERAVFEERFGRALQRCTLYSRSEQEPDGLNGLKLVDETDWAGSYKLEIHNCFSKRDLRSIEKTARLFGEALVARRLGTVKIDNAAVYRSATGGGHTMGTTRMGTNPRNSVCDGNLKVHGYDNLYLAGSSVFPTSGAWNPTLTIVALSLRLADHLVNRLR